MEKQYSNVKVNGYGTKRRAWEDKYEPANASESWQMRAHDVEEFSEIVQRHGM
ncbi:putative metallopeptidase [Aneurinibacillus migulanus]|uniref:putative metallopeptidase n=1 Tax=Aneurinibacillus migulanus TaxID=47500 RepID=UPI000A885E70|nr:putative metallopeptidase [Aneurinibacillus migulanus]MED0892025.1 putative metallopeptidase [Aneurinibacillus migulanus]MED1618337.1 putative metallopeptidase [Aneurinibacillus migulanus]GED18253.1 hypothetical protein AMI01nite_62440 [Aneurinibacillus migulanus]